MTEFPRNQSLFVPNPLFSHNSLCFCVSYLNILPKQRLNSLISSYFFAPRFLSVGLFPGYSPPSPFVVWPAHSWARGPAAAARCSEPRSAPSSRRSMAPALSVKVSFPPSPASLSCYRSRGDADISSEARTAKRVENTEKRRGST